MYFLIGRVNALASQRFAIFSITVFRPSKRLWGLRSLCNIPWPRQRATPLHNWYIKLLMIFVGILSLFWRKFQIYFLKSMSIYSNTKYRTVVLSLFRLYSISINLTTWGSRDNMWSKESSRRVVRGTPSSSSWGCVYFSTTIFPVALSLVPFSFSYPFTYGLTGAVTSFSH